MSRSEIMVLALSLGGICLLPAEDIDVNDLRLKAGILSDAYKQAAPTVDSAAPTYTTSLATNADSNGRIELEWCHIAFCDGGGLVLGVDLALNRAHFTNSDHNTTLWSPVADGVMGYALRLGDILHAEATLFGGEGRASEDGLGFNALRHGSAYYEYGGRIALYGTFASAYQVGIEVPYRFTKTSATSSYVGSDGNWETVTDTRRSVGGFACLLVLGTRF